MRKGNKQGDASWARIKSVHIRPDWTELTILLPTEALRVRTAEATEDAKKPQVRPERCPTWKELLAYCRDLYAGEQHQPLRAVPNHLRHQVMERYQAVKPLLDFRSLLDQGHRPPFVTAAGRAINSMEEFARQLAEQHGVARATIWRWYSSFRKSGLVGLVDRGRFPKPRPAWFDKNPQARDFVDQKYLAERLTIRQAYRALLPVWSSLCPTQGVAPPSYTAVKRYVKKLPGLVVVLARRGERAFSRGCGDSYDKIVEAVRAHSGGAGPGAGGERAGDKNLRG